MATQYLNQLKSVSAYLLLCTGLFLTVHSFYQQHPLLQQFEIAAALFVVLTGIKVMSQAALQAAPGRSEVSGSHRPSAPEERKKSS